MAKLFKLTEKEGVGVAGRHLNSGVSDGALSKHHTQAGGSQSTMTMLTNWGAGCSLLYL